MALEDTQIVAHVLAGEATKYRQLVERHQDPVFRFVRNLVGDEHDAEDLTQEVFVAAFSHLRSYDSKRAAFRTWLFTIARNRCFNYLKRQRPLVAGEELQNATQHVAFDGSTREEFWRELDEALASLPMEQRAAFVLAEIEELPYAKIAIIEQTTLGTVKSRIHRAKQRLRAVLEPTMREE